MTDKKGTIWATRDKGGFLFLFTGEKPIKDCEVERWLFEDEDKTDYMPIDKNLLPEVQWSDEEPTVVKLIIDK